MSRIRLLLTAGAAFYVAVFLAQAAQNWSVADQTLAGVVLLVIATALTLVHDELALKRYEMGLLWVMVLGFLAYAIAHSFGVLA
ncbi:MULTISPECIES: hypothetical protein [Methanoculleus]|jgi:hypothetical protein|uniref:Uncharacterized protein n=1 Tax=Methanoculleus thermophilus TaxID=2200 RepID=A0A1G8YQ16_9EURY|nr:MULTISPECIES: hypothetical protein [Methanoculleus]NLN09506.1 hypothetical protein [Methanoculleus thermophilus]SDK04863.1 hypothetical protein SAMN04488571_103138 [Methanoculleus thermophilus]